MEILFTVFGVLIALLSLNLYFKYQTYYSVDKEIRKMEWNTAPLEEYVQNSYHLVAERFSKVHMCWLRYPWRNMFFTNMWKMRGGRSSLPYANFFVPSAFREETK